MKVNLRFGLHRDIQLLHAEKQLIDGIVVPSNILAHQAASTSVFVASWYDKPYIIDPMTCVLQSSFDDCANDGQLRPSVEKMFAAYHPELGTRMRQAGRLTPAMFPDRQVFCQKVFEFQRDQVAGASVISAANKYLQRYAHTIPTQPRLILSPYFCFSRVGDPWYELSLDCARRMAALTDLAAPVICCSLDSLSPEGITQITQDYNAFQNVFLWLDDYSENSATAVPIRRVRSLISSLRRDGRHIETLYGGYLMIMAFFDGLSALSHGILYTQHKACSVTPGGGGAPERYYIPQIHGFRSLSQTDLIIHKHRELMCRCAVCEKYMGGDPDKIVLFRDDPDLLRRHFLAVRRQEADDIEASSPAEEVTELRRVYAAYDESFQSLPNPDSMLPDAQMQGLNYLSHWADAYAVQG